MASGHGSDFVYVLQSALLYEKVQRGLVSIFPVVSFLALSFALPCPACTFPDAIAIVLALDQISEERRLCSCEKSTLPEADCGR